MTLIGRIKVCDKIQLWNFLQYMSSLLSSIHLKFTEKKTKFLFYLPPDFSVISLEIRGIF